MLYKGTQLICPIVTTKAEIVLESLTVTPSTTAQTITPSSGTDGYNTVIASAVTASIDNNIIAGNIKDGVSILGVTGTLQAGGTTPTGTRTITVNGTYDVTDYASAKVNVPTTNISQIVNYAVKVNDYKITKVRYTSGECGYTYAETQTNFKNAYTSPAYRNTVSKIYLLGYDSMGASTSYSFESAFYGNTAITEIHLDNLHTIQDGRNNLFNRAFANTGIKEMRFTSLQYIDNTYYTDWQLAFAGCNGIHIYFNSLNLTDYNTYQRPFRYLLQGVTDGTVHLPADYSDVDAVAIAIGLDWKTDVIAGFGGTNTTILYDL